MQLRDWVEDSLGRFEDQAAAQERRIDGCGPTAALIRYDAYGEMSGQQSISLASSTPAGRSRALVDHHRDQARVYVEQIHEGQPEVRLSLEEQQAIDEALASAPRAEAARSRRRPARLDKRLTFSRPREGRVPSAPGRHGYGGGEALRALAGRRSGRCERRRCARRSWRSRTVPWSARWSRSRAMLEGSVRATLDTLAGEAPDVRIEAQVTHPIHHCLIAARRSPSSGCVWWCRTPRDVAVPPVPGGGAPPPGGARGGRVDGRGGAAGVRYRGALGRARLAAVRRALRVPSARRQRGGSRRQPGPLRLARASRRSR